MTGLLSRRMHKIRDAKKPWRGALPVVATAGPIRMGIPDDQGFYLPEARSGMKPGAPYITMLSNISKIDLANGI